MDGKLSFQGLKDQLATWAIVGAIGWAGLQLNRNTEAVIVIGKELIELRTEKNQIIYRLDQHREAIKIERDRNTIQDVEISRLNSRAGR